MDIVGVGIILILIFGFIYVQKVERIGRDVKALKEELSALQRGTPEPFGAPAALRQQHFDNAPPVLRQRSGDAPTAPPAPAPPAYAEPRPEITPTPPANQPAVAAAPVRGGYVGPPRPLPQPLPPRRPSAVAQWFQTARSTDEWEQLIGGRGLNLIGALALILAAGFFLKYAFDHNWISPGFRVAMGLVAGFILLGIAYRAHRRDYVIFAHGLVGAGISILYLSIYASFNFYHLIPQPVALAAMAIVTALAFVQSLYYDSLAISLLAWFGGFLTPVLLLTAGGSEVGTAVYVALLVGGLLLLVARKERWFILEPLTMAGAFGIYLLWYAKSYTPASLGLAVVFATILWALFASKDVADILRNLRSYVRERHLLGAGNAILYYAILLVLLLQHHRAWMAAASLILAAVYCATVLAVTRRRSVMTGVPERYALTALVLLIFATAIQFSDFTLAVLWGLEAVLLLGLGRVRQWWYVWAPALGLYTLAALRLLTVPDAWFYTPVGGFHPVLNERVLAYLTLAAAAAACAFLTTGLRTWRLGNRDRHNLVRALQYAACVLPFILLTVETNDIFRLQMLHAGGMDHSELGYLRFLAIGAVWAVYSVILTLAWLRLTQLPVLIAALGSAALATVEIMAAGVRFAPIERFTLVLNPRVGVFLLLGATLFLQLAVIGRRLSAAWSDAVAICIRVTLLVLGFELLSVEVNDYFSRLMATSHGLHPESYGFIRTMIVAGMWTLYSLPIVRYGMVKRQIFTVTAGLATAALGALLGAAAGVEYRPLQWFVPLLNVRAVVLLLLIAAFVVLMQTLRREPNLHPWVRAFVLALEAGMVLLGFELITVETRDFFEHAIVTGRSPMGTASDVHNIEQVVLSVVWLLYAVPLLVVGIWKRSRWLRFGALALFAVTILKVFLYDLSFLGGAYRSISFGGLGLILLAVSFLYQHFKAVLFAPDDAPAL
jgi:hypothetical protein